MYCNRYEMSCKYGIYSNCNLKNDLPLCKLAVMLNLDCSTVLHGISTFQIQFKTNFNRLVTAFDVGQLLNVN